MASVFGSLYSYSYDILYGEKDYEAECDLIERLFERHGSSPIRTLVDLGCGTGNHAVPLSKRGYQVVGVDRSEDMLAHARQKMTPDNSQLRFELGDVQSFDLKRRFDAALMMFAVLGYQLKNQDVLATLKSVRKHLNVGGLFIFDVWYGPAVLRERPSQRIKTIRTPERTVLRAATGELDSYRQTCDVSYQVWQLEKDRLLSETEETHTMRYFFPQELRLFLETTQFELVEMGAFDHPQVLPTETDWNIICTARAA